MVLTTAGSLSNPDSIPRQDLAAASVGGYGIFLGGGREGQSTVSSTDAVDVYDGDLVHTTPTPLLVRTAQHAAASNETYALFGGGTRNGERDNAGVVAYDVDLVAKSAPNLTAARARLAATSIGEYILFGGGYANRDRSYLATVNVYDGDLVRKAVTGLNPGRSQLAAASNDSFALFGCGYKSSYSNDVDAYTIV